MIAEEEEIEQEKVCEQCQLPKRLSALLFVEYRFGFSSRISSYENRLLLTLMHKIADFHASLCPQRHDAFRLKPAESLGMSKAWFKCT